MLDNLGRIICRECRAAMEYRSQVDEEGACFVFYCTEPACGRGDVYRIMTAHVKNKKSHPPVNLDLTLPSGDRARRRVSDQAHMRRS